MKPKCSLSIFTTSEIYEIAFDEIKLIESSGMSSTVLTANGKIHTSKNLGTIESMLNENFFRVNNSIIINRKFIFKYIRTDGGCIVLTCGTKIRPSRDRRQEFIEWYTKGGGDRIITEFQPNGTKFQLI